MTPECHIVRDIQPLYQEGLVSDGTAAFVRQHLETCNACRAAYAAAQAGRALEDAAAQDRQPAQEAHALLSLKKKLRRRAADYAEFAGNYPLADTAVYASQIDTVNFLRNYYTAQFQRNNPELDLSGRALRQAALRELNRAWGVPYESFFSVKFTREMNYPMDFQGYFPPLGDARFEGYLKFKEAVAQHQFTPGIESKFRDFLEDQNFPASPGTELFPVTADSPEPLRRQWDAFKREHAPASPAVPFAMRAVWYSFLSSEQVALDLGLPNGRRFEVADYNRLAGTDYRTLQETPFPVPDSFDEPIRKLWQEFLQERYPLRLASVRVTPELERKYRDYLKEGLKTLKIANSLLGTDCRSWEDFRLPATPPAGGSNEAKNRKDLWKNFVRMHSFFDIFELVH